MNLQERIEFDLKQAMRDRDELVRGTLRMALADLKNKRIELGKDLSDADAEAVLAKAVKSRRDSEAQYREAGRPELAEKEAAEIVVIERYLPEALSEDEARAAVQNAIEQTGATSKQEMGAVMKTLMAEHKGRIDGKTAQRLVGELLG